MGVEITDARVLPAGGDERDALVEVMAIAITDAANIDTGDLDYAAAAYDALRESAVAPSSVGDAEPVAPLTLDEVAQAVYGGEFWESIPGVREDAQRVLDLLARRLPVSSQDAGALVDLVLPAEGEKRRAMVDWAVRWIVRERERYLSVEVAGLVFDALRAAAGKAGSDDARA